MKFTTEIEYTPTPSDMADELWKWDSEQQAEFIYCLFIYYGRENARMIYQLNAVADELKHFKKDERLLIKHRLQDLIDRMD